MMGRMGGGWGHGCPEEVPDSAWLGREDFLEEMMCELRPER